MKTTNHTPIATNKNNFGFSLNEMLLVIAILGIITALAVPVLAQGVNKAGGAKSHRNAQSLAVMAGNAVAAGDMSIPSATSVDEVVDILIVGVDGTGVFEGTFFQVQSLTAEERAEAVALLEFKNGSLLYQAK